MTVGNSPSVAPPSCIPNLYIAGWLTDAALGENNSTGLHLSGNTLYVCGFFSSTFGVLDVTTRDAPSILGTFDSVDDADVDLPAGVTVDGSYAYLCCQGSDVVMVLDVSNPAAISKVGSVSGFVSGIPLSPRWVEKYGDYLVTAGSGRGIVVIDVSNPAAPAVAGQLPTTGYNMNHFSRFGDYLFCADEAGTDGLTVVDISTITSPTFVTKLTDASINGPWYTAVTADGSYCFLSCDNNDTVLSIDIANPASPSIVDAFTNSIVMDRPYGLVLDGDYLYVAASGSMAVLDVSTPTAIALHTSQFDSFANAELANSQGLVKTNDEFLYTSAWKITAVQNECAGLPGRFEVVGSVTAASLNGAAGVAMHGDYAIVASALYGGVAVVDVSTPSAPSVVGAVSDAILFNTSRVAMYGDYAVATSMDDRVVVIDVSTPSSPTIAGSVQDASALSAAWGIDIIGNYAIVTSNSSGSYVTSVDLSTPSAPVVADSITAASLLFAGDLRISGTVAYVAINADAVTTVDVSDPTNLAVLGTVSHAGLDGADGIAISGSHAFVGAFSNRISSVDISNPAAPSYLSTRLDNFTLDNAGALVVSGDYAFVCAEDRDIVTVVDISIPAGMNVVESTGTSQMDFPTGIAIYGQYLVVSSYSSDSLTIIHASRYL